MNETSIFNLHNTFVIFSFFPFLLSCNIAIDFCFLTSGWVKNPYVKKCYLVFRPKHSRTNVQPSLISHIRWSAVKRLTSQGLKKGINSHVVTYFIDQICILRKWLFLNETRPPFLHIKLCWRSYFSSEQHVFGKGDNGHPYRIFTRSQNSCFDKLYPFLLSVELIAT